LRSLALSGYTVDRPARQRTTTCAPLAAFSFARARVGTATRR